ncbi:MAG TPA: OsmC family protein [Thermoplasmata archaeon]|nr:OsmC family protein [Thermoplasmata archaeon]
MESESVNGIELRALNGVIEAIKATPAVAQATFAVQADTDYGFHTRSRTGQPTLGGQPIAGRTRAFRFEGGHPPELLGKDEGPAAVEGLLASLAACVSGGFTTFGAHLGIPVEHVRMDITGYVDLQGMLGLPEPGAVRPGYQRIHARITVKSPASRADLEKLKTIAEAASPVKDSLRAVPYTSELIVEK